MHTVREARDELEVYRVSRQREVAEDRGIAAGGDARRQLLAALPVTERRIDLAGVSTAVLEGGDGPPLVLLHGPGEFAAGSVRVLPDLVTNYRVVVPDLPGHGASTVVDGPLDAGLVLAWLGELIESTCTSPPAIVGRAVGGAVAARFAGTNPDRVGRLVLVDTFGLAELRPAARFELALTRFLARPRSHSYDRLMAESLFDVDGARDQLGALWGPLEAYAIECARTPSVRTAVGALISQFGVVPIKTADLDRISIPTTLIWGRHDLATSLDVAQAASARFGWPLVVIDDAGDDPSFDQPEAFLAALHDALG